LSAVCCLVSAVHLSAARGNSAIVSHLCCCSQTIFILSILVRCYEYTLLCYLENIYKVFTIVSVLHSYTRGSCFSAFTQVLSCVAALRWISWCCTVPI
jgi:hypothetical protein